MTIVQRYTDGTVHEVLEVLDQTLTIESTTEFNGYDCDRDDIGERLVSWPRGTTEEGDFFFVPNDPKGILEIY